MQANERTLLAWIRTSLAMMTFGFVVARLDPWLNELGGPNRKSQVTTAVGVAFVGVAVLVDVAALVRYRRATNDMVAGRAPTTDSLPLIFGAVVTALGMGIVAYIASAFI